MNFIEILVLMFSVLNLLVLMYIICLICYHNHEMNHGSDVTNLDHN
jgi:phage shock protein PspC (stress-responsive transcriptional regulator)